MKFEKEVINYFKKDFFSDLKAGFITAIVALPLAIAFAIASGVPPIMGLYTAIIADLFAAVPTFMFLWKNPEEDLPFAWSLYAIGYGLAIFAVKENTFANYALPVYMCIGSSSIASILIAYRIKKSIPLKEWI